ncbi:MAG TPA: sigma factor, partial [Ktedonobacterales bacterium]
MEGWGTRPAPVMASPAHPAQTLGDRLWRRLLMAIEHGELANATALNQSREGLRTHIGQFEPFFREHQRDIFTYLWRMTGDEQAAYDLTQETFLRAWRHFARVRDYERPGGWLFRVATHLALNYLRGRSSSLGSALSLDSPVASHTRVTLPSSPDLSAAIADADM